MIGENGSDWIKPVTLQRAPSEIPHGRPMIQRRHLRRGSYSHSPELWRGPLMTLIVLDREFSLLTLEFFNFVHPPYNFFLRNLFTNFIILFSSIGMRDETQLRANF
jgi:hypothetical protein